MKSFRFCFWAGLLCRWACAPWLAARADLDRLGDERAWLETLSFASRWLSAPRGAVLAHALVGTATWIGLWRLVQWFRRAHGPAGDGVAAAFAWFCAVYFVFLTDGSRPTPGALSLVAVAFLWMAVERRWAWRSGFWAGWGAMLSAPSGFWGLGAATLAIARGTVSGKPRPRRLLGRTLVGVVLGLIAGVVLGNLADRLGHGGGGYSNLPWRSMTDSGLAGLVPASAPPLLALPALALAIYALVMTPAILLFVIPFGLVGGAAGYWLQLTPFLALAVATAYQRGRFVWLRQKLAHPDAPKWLRIAAFLVFALNGVALGLALGLG